MTRLFRVFIPTSVLALLISEVILLHFCFVMALIVVTDVDPEFVLFYDGGLPRISIAVLSILLALYFQDLYTELRIRSRSRASCFHPGSIQPVARVWLT